MIRKNFLFSFLFIAATVLLSACGPGSTPEKATTATPDNLVGTWKLKQRIDHANNETEWENVEGSIVYDKYLTDTHFTWINYDEENDVLVGIGGGTYSFSGDTYIENIEFFLPPTSSILGQKIIFEASFEDGKWYHTGYTKEMEFDPELAQTVVVDSSRIEEIWEKVSDVSDGAETVQGTWELQSYRDNADGIELSYPDFVNYVKLITPSHFIWIQYNDEGDEVSGAGSGRYRYDNGQYTETIQMMYPSGNDLTGGKVTFRCDINDNRWSHLATKFSKAGQETDSIYIDEKWAKVGSL